MPLPNDQIAELCLKWANGNKDAGAFLLTWASIVRNADDIADGDSKAPVPDMAQLLMQCIVGLSNNTFFSQNKTALLPVMANAIALWVKSEEWKRSTLEKSRIFGFVGREAVEHVTYTVALMTGGYQHQLAVIEELHQASHVSSAETFADWVKEGIN